MITGDENLRVLVTGGAGFIGRNLVKDLLANNFAVSVIDTVSSSDKKAQSLIQLGAHYYNGDIRDLPSIEQAGEGCSHIVHLAAQTSVPASLANPELNDEVNLNGTLNIIRYSNSNNIKKVVFASSAAVYGNCEDVPLVEESAGSCLSPYAKSKFQNEKDLLSLMSKEPQVHILRFFNVYGPGQDTNSSYAAVIPSFIQRIISGQSPIIFGDGSQSRDFIAVSDVVDLIIHILVNSNNPKNGVYNVATQTETSINELLRIIKTSISQTDNDIEIPEIKYQRKRSGDITSSCADISKTVNSFGWSPKVSLAQGIKSLVEFELRG
ncbi:MAG: LPS biosynthesis protein WbpP [Euryarchaeota archaeon]|nr:LPS biosynthesis protein WbpP [Euryarchaeota archaeon]